MSTSTEHWTVESPMSSAAIADEGMVPEKAMISPQREYVRIPMALNMLEETMILLNNRVSSVTVRAEAGDWVIEVG